MAFLIRVVSLLQVENSFIAADFLSTLIKRDNSDVITCMLERCDLLDTYNEVVCAHDASALVINEVLFGLSNLVISYHAQVSDHPILDGVMGLCKDPAPTQKEATLVLCNYI
jgi:hypothetical protein